jgi:hypothetical protein
MKIQYAHHLTKYGPRDFSPTLIKVSPELEEIGGYSKDQVRESVIRFMRWHFDDAKADIAVKIEVFRGESLSMVTASGDGFVIGWESKK